MLLGLDLPSVRALSVLTCLSVAAVYSAAQTPRGEMRLEVRDPTGAPIIAAVDLSSDLNQLRRQASTDAMGIYVAQALPFGVYRLSISRDGFQASTQIVRIGSEVPVHIDVMLRVAAIESTIEVTSAATLIDPNRINTVNSIGTQTIEEHLAAQPGRTLLDLVDAQPGWLYEANGVLHPRGSEYDVQFVVDGVPLTENRSPGFAPNFESDDVESMRVMTAGYPAEYGRKLGGVVELSSSKDATDGLRGDATLGGGSFNTLDGSATIAYGRGPNRFSATGFASHTDRYLDPPVLENFTNTGSSGGGTFSYSRELTTKDRLRFEASESSVHFDVPNERVQQEAGQRQDRANRETSGLIYYQRVISPSVLLDGEASVRDDSARLWSNVLSTPMVVAQQRGFIEGYARADVAWHSGHNDWKAGADGIFSSVHESLQYTITDLSQFDPATSRHFDFAARLPDHEPAVYVQDTFHAHNWNLSAGIRFDHYRLAATSSGVSPRVGISRFFPKTGLLVHVSYDRVFQTPARENLLLASSSAVDVLNNTVVRLPVPPSHGNFYEAGFSRALWGKLRLEATVFRRDFRDYSDDNTLLNTGVSFPIAFANARVRGEEIKIEVPRWGRFSGFVSYSNQLGMAQGPVTGGLFLGEDAAGVLKDNSRFFVSQDQRNTARARVRAQVFRRAWVASSASYGSGLPVDLEQGNTDFDFLLAQYGAQTLNHVNFDRGRTRPMFSLDAAAGVELMRHDRRAVTVQAEASNLTNRVNVINFASLFSGTAIAAPRSAAVALKVQF